MDDYLTKGVNGARDRDGIREFFFTNFGSDWQKDHSSVADAADDYLAHTADRTGTLLMQELDDLIKRDFSEEELEQLIDVKWQTQGNVMRYGSYRGTLIALQDYLEKRLPRLRKN